MNWVVHNVKDQLIESFGRESWKYLTLVCIPASSNLDTERRFKDFSSMLCEETGMGNAYPYITVSQEVVPKSLGGTGRPTLEFDTGFFKSKNVLIFDDIITKGLSMIRMKQKLEQLGATVIAGISIGKTFHHRPEDQNVNTRRSSIFDDDLPF
jgi:predicted amidophosphoribosyltransferase